MAERASPQAGAPRTISSMPAAEVVVTDLDDRRRRVEVVPSTPTAFIARRSIETDYPDSLLHTILTVKGYGFLCDEVARDQDPSYLQRHLEATIVAHVDPAELAGKRILDFGCGAGASTCILSRVLPDSEIVGIELAESLLTVARERAAFYGMSNVHFLTSPAPDSLPPDLGTFDAVVLSAVYEHLLPHERRRLMPVIWQLVRPGGYLVIDETPWRWFPVETHTTKLPLLNYVPDSTAQRMARRSAKLRGRTDWPELLRAGIRGGTTKEITRDLGATAGQARLLDPQRNGIDNRVDLWFEGYAGGDARRFARLKRSSKGVMRLVERTTGVAPVPYLSLVYHKRAAS